MHTATPNHTGQWRGLIGGFAAGSLIPGILPGRPASLSCADAGRPVRKVAVVGGAGVDMAEHALAQGCDTLVTSDVRYHEFLDVRDQGLNLMDAGHFPTENLVCSVLADWLRKGFPETEVWISERHREIFSCL